jgi:seryl-tRNA synthetase
MLDIKLIRENPDLVRQRLASRGRGDEVRVAEIAGLDEQRRKLLTEGDNLKAERNKVSKEIGAAKSKGQDASAAMAAMKQVGERIAGLDVEIAGVDAKLQDILLNVPNLPHESVVAGKDAADNPEMKRWGDKPAFAFQPKPHWEIGEKLGILDSFSTKVPARDWNAG